MTIVQQIEDIESEIKKNEERLDTIERMERLSTMTDEERSNLKQERKIIEKRLSNSRKQLKRLRWENWRSMIVSVVLLGMVYVSYIVITGTGSSAGATS
ncbi:coiled-coil domain-containing protein 167-like [Plakobranchus ocellatus]|uniref:Coiled-coil domain-containing protein 167 n=1 Tax=Plakobranchus ocellatus TaxID=259542 RepID=A0AAV3YQB5_9GAST|nr:coiled-coil domain-containing protein 167-like [Plakobranchus ocellatus]